MRTTFRKLEESIFSNRGHGDHFTKLDMMSTLSMKIITTGLMCLTLFVKGEPVCYTRRELGANSAVIQQTDCKMRPLPDFKSFPSREDVSTNDLLYWPFVSANVDPVGPTETTSLKGDIQAISCFSNDLPSIENGSFNCTTDSQIPEGGTCVVTCVDDFYLVPSDHQIAICEAGIENQLGKWSYTNFSCQEIKCSEDDLPGLTNGVFQCPSVPYKVANDVCNVSCETGFYSSPSGKAVCQAMNGNGGHWFGGNSCLVIECDKWNSRGDKEYKFIDKFQDWNKSRQSCEDENAYIITIENEDVNDFLEQMILPHCNIHWGTWIGFSDLAIEGTWQWDSGTSALFTNWDDSDPEGDYIENCAMMKSENGRWNDYPCDESFPTVCERSVLSNV